MSGTATIASFASPSHHGVGAHSLSTPSTSTSLMTSDPSLKVSQSLNNSHDFIILSQVENNKTKNLSL